MKDFWITNKVIIDETEDGVTYIWLTPYKKCEDKYYWWEWDTAKPIWKIKKIVEEDWITEFFYPNWDHHNIFVWDNRDTYDYV